VLPHFYTIRIIPQTSSVMSGFEPHIHVFCATPETQMAGTSPAMAQYGSPFVSETN